jgi:hypothetical protein
MLEETMTDKNGNPIVYVVGNYTRTEANVGRLVFRMGPWECSIRCNFPGAYNPHVKVALEPASACRYADAVFVARELANLWMHWTDRLNNWRNSSKAYFMDACGVVPVDSLPPGAKPFERKDALLW